MKFYIAIFITKNVILYQNSLENMTIPAENRKDALEKARRYARHNELKFISIRLVK